MVHCDVNNINFNYEMVTGIIYTACVYVCNITGYQESHELQLAGIT